MERNEIKWNAAPASGVGYMVVCIPAFIRFPFAFLVPFPLAPQVNLLLIEWIE